MLIVCTFFFTEIYKGMKLNSFSLLINLVMRTVTKLLPVGYMTGALLRVI